MTFGQQIRLLPDLDTALLAPVLDVQPQPEVTKHNVLDLGFLGLDDRLGVVQQLLLLEPRLPDVVVLDLVALLDHRLPDVVLLLVALLLPQAHPP